MHKKTYEIMKNLGYPQTLIEVVETGIAEVKEKEQFLDTWFTTMGTPEMAIAQIKTLEIKKSKVKEPEINNKELITSLVKKCKRSLDALARKGIVAKILFHGKKWKIESETYHPGIKQLYNACHKHFDTWAKQGTRVIFEFDGTTNWYIITAKKSDQPDLD